MRLLWAQERERSGARFTTTEKQTASAVLSFGRAGFAYSHFLTFFISFLLILLFHYAYIFYDSASTPVFPIID